jgi:RNA polymerase sigma-70 factor, ECF subfamily
MNMPTDAELLDRLLRGDTRSLGQLYERYRVPLFRFCLRMLKDTARAEDAVHDTFLKLARQHTGIAHPVAFRSWLFRVARNEVFMALRRITPVPLDEEDGVWDPSTPHDILEQSEQNARLHAMLDALRPDYREVLILKEFEDMRYAEIAMVTGSTESAVRSRIFKARRALSERLTGLRKERTS